MASKQGSKDNLATESYHHRSKWDTRTSFVIHTINSDSRPSKNILDVGFIGSYKEASVHYSIVNNLRESDSLVGIDINESKMNLFLSNPKARELQSRKNIKYEIMSIFDTDFEDNTFDYVLLLEVFEHLSSPYLVFEEVRRILKPGGSVIITYPNPLDLFKLLKYIYQKDLLDIEYLSRFKGQPDHKVFPHPVCLAAYLNEAGFQTGAIEYIKYVYLKRFDTINRIISNIGLFKKFSNYIGIWAMKTEM